RPRRAAAAGQHVHLEDRAVEPAHLGVRPGRHARHAGADDDEPGPRGGHDALPARMLRAIAALRATYAPSSMSACLPWPRNPAVRVAELPCQVPYWPTS